MHMANSIRSPYYVYDRSGSPVKHTLDDGCQPQLRYLLFTSKEHHIFISQKKADFFETQV